MAAAVSAACHAALVAFGRLELPSPPEAALPLAARIVTALAPAAAPQRSEPRNRSPAPKQHAPRETARADTTPAWTLPAERADELVLPADEAETVENSASAADGSPTPSATAASEPITVATAPPSTYSPEPPPLRSLPRKGRISYNLVYGRDGFPVGRTTQSWEMSGGQYLLASRSETIGIVDLFRSQHRTYLSRGSVTREGLRPATFLSSRNRGRGTEEARAQFDWDEATVTLQAQGNEKREALPPHSQDLLSFMYQLSLNPPPPGRLRQVVTNGSRIEVYELDVLPEETIETPLGALRALPLKQRPKPGQEAIELWLATEYRYLPVRLRFFDRQGEPQGEQIVTEIRLSDE